MKMGMFDFSASAGPETILLEQRRWAADDREDGYGSIELTPEQIELACELMRAAKLSTLAQQQELAALEAAN